MFQFDSSVANIKKLKPNNNDVQGWWCALWIIVSKVMPQKEYRKMTWKWVVPYFCNFRESIHPSVNNLSIKNAKYFHPQIMRPKLKYDNELHKQRRLLQGAFCNIITETSWNTIVLNSMAAVGVMLCFMSSSLFIETCKDKFGRQRNRWRLI